MANGTEPREHLERALRVRHLAALSEERVHALTRQAEETAEIGLRAMFAQMGPQLATEFVP